MLTVASRGPVAFYHLDVNPEPWAVGPLGLGRRNGKMFPRMGRNESVHAFKESVRDEFAGVQMLPEGKYDLMFFFWRRLDSYTAESGRKVNAHQADATNMQKALEDALQGVLFGNDRDVTSIGSEIIEQGADVKPQIVIRAGMAHEYPTWAFPDDIAESVQKPLEFGSASDNAWPPS